MTDKPILAIIVPCYNEQEVLEKTSEKLFNKLQELISGDDISKESKIVFIDDGSTDNTWPLITKYFIENSQNFAGIKLSKNKGHQNALLCGLLTIRETIDLTISLDADLQDDIEIISKMLKEYLDGNEIVYGVRSDRTSDHFLKKFTAHCFYKLMNLLGVEIIYNHADFRLLSKNALNALAEYQEVNLFLRGIIPMLGFKTSIVSYKRNKRFAGTSKYPLGKMIKFALEGITSFSIVPIRFITIIGLVIFLVSLMMLSYSLLQFHRGNTVSGWSSIICSVWSIGGLILLSLGIIGEYIGKIYLETKHRPRFIIEKLLFRSKHDD